MQPENRLTRSSLDFIPSNSDKKSLSEERTKRAPVVKHRVKKVKKTFGAKIKEAFIGEEGNIGDYILYDVLIPAFKDSVSDIVSGSINTLFYKGERRQGPRMTRDRGRTWTSYESSYRDPFNRERGRHESRVTHDFSAHVFETRGDAEEVLSRLVDLTLEFGLATVADFYEFSNLESVYTDSKYGWTTLRDACTERVRDGYVLRLPKPRPI